MKQNLFLIAIIFLAVSCKKATSVYDVHEVDCVNKSEVTIKGVPVSVELPLDIRDIAVCDSFLIVTGHNDEARMSVYSSDWKYLGRYCFIGRARNEFLHDPGMVSGQILRGKDGHALIPLKDGLECVKVMDLQQSLEAGRTVISTESSYKPYKEAVIEEEFGTITARNDINFVFIDNDIRHQFEWCRPMLMNGTVRIDPYYAIMHDTTVISRVNTLDIFDDEQFKFIHGYLFKHPSRNLIIFPLNYIDYILMIDVDNDRIWAIHQQGSLSFDDQLPYVDFTTTHFGQAVCTESYFMVLYCAGDINKDASESKDVKPELMFFDWEGNFIRSVILDTRVYRIAFDEKKQILYGVDSDNDRIISFDLSSVMTDIDKPNL